MLFLKSTVLGIALATLAIASPTPDDAANAKKPVGVCKTNHHYCGSHLLHKHWTATLIETRAGGKPSNHTQIRNSLYNCEDGGKKLVLLVTCKGKCDVEKKGTNDHC